MTTRDAPRAKAWREQLNGRQLRTSSSAAFPTQTTDGPKLTRSINRTDRKSVILLILRSWLAAPDDFRNWLIREAAQMACY
jgi:hypothetical protein